MKVRLERSRSAGHAQCFAVDSALFPVDDDGYSTLGEHDVAPDDVDAVRAGVAVCPEVALVIEDGDQVDTTG